MMWKKSALSGDKVTPEVVRDKLIGELYVSVRLGAIETVHGSRKSALATLPLSRSSEPPATVLCGSDRVTLQRRHADPRIRHRELDLGLGTSVLLWGEKPVS